MMGMLVLSIAIDLFIVVVERSEKMKFKENKQGAKVLNDLSSNEICQNRKMKQS